MRWFAEERKSHAKVMKRTNVHAADQATLAKLQGQLDDFEAAVEVYKGMGEQLL